MMMATRSPNRWFYLLPALLLGFVLALLFLGDLRSEALSYVILACGATLTLYAAYGVLVRRNLTLTPRSIVLIAVALRLLALPLEPSLSDDAWRYIWDGRLLAEGHLPYDGPPSDPQFSYLHDYLYEVQGYKETNTIYPPLVQLIFAGSTSFVEPSDRSTSLTAYLIWKILLLLAEVAAILLLIRLFRHLGRSLNPLILYAWHPLAVVELAGQGHTDGLWVVALGIAYYGFAASRAGAGAWGLGFGAAVRLFPLLLMPIWSRFLKKGERWIAFATAAPFLLLFLVFADPEVFERYTTVAGRFTNYYEFNGGVYQGIKYLLDLGHIKPSNEIAGTITTGLLLLGVLLITFWPLRKRSFESLLSRGLGIITLQIALTAKSHIWYGVAPLYLATLETRPRFRPLWLWLSLTAPLTYLYFTVEPNSEFAFVLWLEWGGGAVIWAATAIREQMSKGASKPSRV